MLHLCSNLELEFAGVMVSSSHDMKVPPCVDNNVGKKLAYLEMRTIYSLIVWNFELQPIPESLLDFKAQDVITHQPQNSRVILKEVK